MLGRYFKHHFNITKYEDTQLKRISKSAFGIPKIKVSHDGDPHKSNIEHISSNKKDYKNSFVIFLVRDPRDIIVSLYYHELKRTQNFKGTIHEFIHQPQNPLDKITKFYNIWGDNQNLVKSFHLVKYEDLNLNPLSSMRNLLSYLNIKDIDLELLYNVINYYSFDNMQKIEKDSAYTEFWIRPKDKNDPHSFKTREGKIGNYVNHLSYEDINFVNKKLARELRYFYSIEP
jgi:hypothetical protein